MVWSQLPTLGLWPLGEGGEHGGCELRLDGCDACGVGRAGHLRRGE